MYSFFGNQRMNIKHLSHNCMRYIISIKILLVCWFSVCLVSGLFKYLPPECVRQSACYWPASLGSLVIITIVGNIYKSKLTTDMRVHLKGDVPGGQFTQTLFSHVEAQLRVSPSNSLINIQSKLCCVEQQNDLHRNTRHHCMGQN